MKRMDVMVHQHTNSKCYCVEDYKHNLFPSLIFLTLERVRHPSIMCGDFVSCSLLGVYTLELESDRIAFLFCPRDKNLGLTAKKDPGGTAHDNYAGRVMPDPRLLGSA